MSIHIGEVFEYLEKHPIRSHNGGITSLMEMLCDTYAEYNFTDSKEIKAAFEKLEDFLTAYPKNQANQFYSQVCEICWEHEVLAFSHGIVVGMHLMTEVNYLP